MKYSFSRQHLSTADYFARSAKKLESKGVKHPDNANLQSNHRSHVTGAVFSAVAGLESSINELFLEAVDRNSNTLAGLDKHAVHLLGGMWAELERSQLLSKYQAALVLCEKQLFNKGTAPYQPASHLVTLRNALVHYKPEWDDEEKVHAKIRLSLKGRFAENRLYSGDDLWFPHKCLGAGCARWSVLTAVAFLNAFSDRLGIPRRT